MDNEITMVRIFDTDITAKEYRGKMVVTFKDIDLCHKRPEGTAKRNFNKNKVHFIEGEDYFSTTYAEFSTNFVPNLSKSGNPNNQVILLTESGYLMTVKSLHDDLAWKVQRMLVNSYFNCSIINGCYKRNMTVLRLLYNIYLLLNGKIDSKQENL